MTTKVPSKDYRRQHEALWDELAPAIKRTIFEDDPILGDAVVRFETALAQYHQVRYAVGVGSGMAALELMLRASGIGAGDEVLTGAHTFTGCISAVRLAGARPVLIDGGSPSGVLRVADVQRHLTARTRAVLAVHMYGEPIDMTGLAELCGKAAVILFEDAAQAHGAKWKGRPVGSFGAATALSFHPSKNLGAFGDGGAVLTSDEALAERIRVARNLGKTGKYEFGELASNNKLDTLQATILEIKLRHLDDWVLRRRALAEAYQKGLAGVGDLALPGEGEHAYHSYHLFVVRTRWRDELRRYLHERGINAGLHYPIAGHRQGAHAALYADQSFPIAEQAAASVLTLPLSHELERGEIEQVIGAVRSFYESKSSS